MIGRLHQTLIQTADYRTKDVELQTSNYIKLQNRTTFKTRNTSITMLLVP